MHLPKTIFNLSVTALLFCTCAENEKDQNIENYQKQTSAPEQIEIVTTDWKGAYSGILPCADCEGIKMRLALHDDLTYKQEVHYLGKEDQPKTITGSFVWNDMGNIAILTPATGGTTMQFLIGENMVTMLDTEGRKIEGNLSERYILRRATE
jgi:uncharacterized lipoprotein NlpE involved in copper resistance